MKILITGERGYIGGILKKSFEVKHDIYTLGYDLLDFRHLLLSLKEIQPDVIIHCAGASSVFNSLEDPYNDFEKNVLTTRNLLEGVRLCSPKIQFIYMSSAAVYGNPEKMPISEEDAFNPISPYGYSKVCAETLIKQYTDIYKIKCAVLRVFSIYGNEMKKQVVYDIFSKFFNPDLTVIELFGTGNEERDFIHIEDFKKVIIMFIERELTGTFNIASGYSTRIKDLAETIQKVVGSNKKIVFKGESREGDPIKWQVDTNKIKELGFHPSISLYEGIKLYHEWFKQQK